MLRKISFLALIAVVTCLMTSSIIRANKLQHATTKKVVFTPDMATMHADVIHNIELNVGNQAILFSADATFNNPRIFQDYYWGIRILDPKSKVLKDRKYWYQPFHVFEAKEINISDEMMVDDLKPGTYYFQAVIYETDDFGTVGEWMTASRKFRLK